MTQARAVCHVADREILTVNAALGHREFPHEGQWETMPTDVPRPEDCPRARPPDGPGRHRPRPPRPAPRQGPRLRRPSTGRCGDGQTLLWARIPEVLDGVDGATLAVLGDFVPMGVGQALGIRGGGNSLDNTLRLVKLVPTDWVLLDIHVHAVERGLRARAGPHVRRGRHPAGHGQPELHHAHVAGPCRRRQATRRARLRGRRGPRRQRARRLSRLVVGALTCASARPRACPSAARGRRRDARRRAGWPRRRSSATRRGDRCGGTRPTRRPVVDDQSAHHVAVVEHERAIVPVLSEPTATVRRSASASRRGVTLCARDRRRARRA